MRPVLSPMAPEGAPFLFLTSLSALIFSGLELLGPALFFLVLSAFILYFFRDPERVTPAEAGAIIAPADGRIIKVEELDDTRFLGEKVCKISIFMSLFNVHVNRIPLAGTVQRIHFQPGRFYAADQEKAELHNEHLALILSASGGRRYAVVQVAGLIARRIVCRAETGDTLKTGERYGLIRFGSRVDLYLPLSAKIAVKPGARVRAGETLLGVLPPP